MKVVSKQKNSHMCVICGMDNDAGVRAQFYQLEDGSVGGLFTYREEHQSYPERVHGGMLATMVDELAGRVLWVEHPDKVAVTMSMQMRYHKPAPYGVMLKGRGVITKMLSRAYDAHCEIFDMDGDLLAEGDARYMILPAEKICSSDLDAELDVFIPDDVTEIEF